MFSHKSVLSKLILPILMILLLSIVGCGSKPSQDDKPLSSVVTKEGVVTYENYLKIKLDATYDDVKGILGEGKKREGKVDVVSYKWEDQDKTIEVQTNKGKIESKSQTKLEKTTAKLTEAQFNKITEGMTIEQVAAILGPDYGEVSSKKSDASTVTMVVWRLSDAKNVKVKLQDGKVTKTYNFLK